MEHIKEQKPINLGNKSNNNKPELLDWYKKCPKKFLTEQRNPHYETHHIKLPFRMIIAGNSGSGKTQTLLNILYNMPDTFDNIWYITKNKDEPLLNFLDDKLKNQGFILDEGIESLPDLDKMDKEKNNLIILDDLVNEPLKQQRPICDYVIRCRKKSCSFVYISQSFYAVPKLIRDNITYLILKQVSSMKNLTMICRECSLGVDKHLLKKIYDDATQTKQTFLLLDLDGEPNEKFRKNLDEVYDIPEEE
jgi:ABC-type dipeptide/oligopeptide/nickel transport system ATPase component